MSPAQNNNWRPTASTQTLQRRARLLADIRAFFASRQVLEVETPLMCRHTVTDRYIDSFAVPIGEQHFYLQTSPEYAMKRLLAADVGAIYQICKAFRNEEASVHHNPEFTMLEWYRPQWGDEQLREEIDALIQTVIDAPAAITQSYQQVFLERLHIDPLSCDETELQQLIETNSPGEVSDAWLNSGKDALLTFCFNRYIENQFNPNQPIFIIDFPASQAALAVTNPKDPRTAKRFELYYKGLELANGFQELTDAAEQQSRFEKDQHARKSNGQFVPEIDQRLLDALSAGLPACAGVALGIDRLLMCLDDAPDTIAANMSFGFESA